jgi:hypothetical protein
LRHGFLLQRGSFASGVSISGYFGKFERTAFAPPLQGCFSTTARPRVYTLGFAAPPLQGCFSTTARPRVYTLGFAAPPLQGCFSTTARPRVYTLGFAAPPLQGCFSTTAKPRVYTLGFAAPPLQGCFSTTARPRVYTLGFADSPSVLAAGSSLGFYRKFALSVGRFVDHCQILRQRIEPLLSRQRVDFG